MMEDLEQLVRTLVQHQTETEWFELKHNNDNNEMIARNISALANSATRHGRDKAYIVWGIEDNSRNIIGTSFNPYTAKIGNQDLEIWLVANLSKNCEFSFNTISIDSKNIVVLEISNAKNQPVTFKSEGYIRVGSSTKELKGLPTLQGSLWEKLRKADFESLIANKDLELSTALDKLDYQIYFERKEMPTPHDIEQIAFYLLQDEILKKQDNNLYSITNLGAILFAKKLEDFPDISHKAIRIVQYKGKNKSTILKNISNSRGYTIGFTETIDTLKAMLPSQEKFVGAVRETVTAYPEIVLRELIANALIHQDFSIAGNGPIVEVFEDRVEITNLGTPLIDIERIVDNPPKSRNNKLSSLMRNLKMCEELGSGWDRVILVCEDAHLFAPQIKIYPENMQVVIYEKRNFSNITREDRVWTCYLHACIQYINGDNMTNASLRARFGLDEKSKSKISRLIKETLEMEKIKVFDPNTAPKYLKYIPYWAK